MFVCHRNKKEVQVTNIYYTITAITIMYWL